jgi:hypothetical protein
MVCGKMAPSQINWAMNRMTIILARTSGVLNANRMLPAGSRNVPCEGLVFSVGIGRLLDTNRRFTVAFRGGKNDEWKFHPSIRDIKNVDRYLPSIFRGARNHNRQFPAAFLDVNNDAQEFSAALLDVPDCSRKDCDKCRRAEDVAWNLKKCMKWDLAFRRCLLPARFSHCNKPITS